MDPLDHAKVCGIYCGLEELADTLPAVKTVSAKQDRALDDAARRLNHMAAELRQLANKLKS